MHVTQNVSLAEVTYLAYVGDILRLGLEFLKPPSYLVAKLLHLSTKLGLAATTFGKKESQFTINHLSQRTFGYIVISDIK